MDQLTVLFLVLLGTVLAVPIANRLRIPYPILITVYGTALALIPWIPDISISPELILPLLLPPLLYAAGRRTSWQEFRANLRPILLLAVALVFVTTFVVAVVAHAVMPGLPIAAAVALGALLAPPDPAAATSVARGLPIPRRTVSLIEGEGLFNDATALVLYNVAVAAAVSGEFVAGQAIGLLAVSAVIAVAVGFAVGWLTRWLEVQLGDPTLRSGLTLLMPFVAYVLADGLHGSGVLAVLVMALYQSARPADIHDVEARLTGRAFWEVVELLVTGVAFAVIGLEVNAVLRDVGNDWGSILLDAGAVVTAVIAVRALWLFPMVLLARRRGRLRSQPHHHDVLLDGDEDIATVPESDSPVSWRETVVLWWAGMRGVATAALALALPLTVDGGGDFPDRSRLILIAYVVIVVTLVLQGLTLPLVVRWLGFVELPGAHRAEHDIAVRAAKAALRRLRELEEERDLPDDVVQRLRARHKRLLAQLSPEAFADQERAALQQQTRRVELAQDLEDEMFAAARLEIQNARSQPGTDPVAADEVLRRLDIRSLR